MAHCSASPIRYSRMLCLRTRNALARLCYNTLCHIHCNLLCYIHALQHIVPLCCNMVYDVRCNPAHCACVGLGQPIGNALLCAHALLSRVPVTGAWYDVRVSSMYYELQHGVAVLQHAVLCCNMRCNTA